MFVTLTLIPNYTANNYHKERMFSAHVNQTCKIFFLNYCYIHIFSIVHIIYL